MTPTPASTATVRPTVNDPASVEAAIESRQSVRAFLPTPVPRPLLERQIGRAHV